MDWKKTLNAARVAIFAVLLALLCVPLRAYAQDWSFALDQEVVDVWINQDGSISLEYWFTFTCNAGAHPIDAVDVGLPNGDYKISGMQGDVDGKPIDRIDSDYQGKGAYGVAVWLGAQTIDPGKTGTVHVFVDRVGSMVYADSKDTGYASTEFSPTWFGSEAHGTTDLTVRFHLPEGVKPEEPRWHASPSGWPQDQPDTGLDKVGRVLYTWYNPAAAPDRQYTFGASFPRQYVAEGAIQQGPSGLEALFGTLTAALGCLCNPAFLIVAGIGGLMALGAWSQRRQRMQYLPPAMRIEGVGIKRGLTAAESAILLETPLSKVLTMILFGLLKKGAVTVLSDNPLKVEANEPVPADLHPYEKGFLEAVTKDGTLGEAKLKDMVVGLVRAVNDKMKGFSRKESAAYYRDIVRRAWQEVASAETPEVRSQRFDDQLEWTMLDDNFQGRMGQTFGTGPVFVPVWWGLYRPWAFPQPAATTAGPAARPSTTARPGMGRVQLPTLPGAAFAATMVRGIEGTASRIVKNVTGFTGGVREVTNPAPKPSYSGRSSGGGGSGCACACACACAGCACACAGGGR
jgi:hypothetical protein